MGGLVGGRVGMLVGAQVGGWLVGYDDPQFCRPGRGVEMLALTPHGPPRPPIAMANHGLHVPEQFFLVQDFLWQHLLQWTTCR